jgi:formiminotetrahydrofolate cyclodeaminase
MARAGAHGAYYNVLINLRSLTDKKWAEAVRKKADSALTEVDKTANEVQKIVNDKLNS